MMNYKLYLSKNRVPTFEVAVSLDVKRKVSVFVFVPRLM